MHHRNLSKKFDITTVRGLFLGMTAIFCYFLFITLLLKLLFIASFWDSLRNEGADRIAQAIISGFPFDVSILSYVFLPAILLYCSVALTRHRLLKGMIIEKASFQYRNRSGTI